MKEKHKVLGLAVKIPDSQTVVSGFASWLQRVTTKKLDSCSQIHNKVRYSSEKKPLTLDKRINLGKLGVRKGFHREDQKAQISKFIQLYYTATKKQVHQEMSQGD